jgi:glycosyltransferase involved in cell wall biosynthesis
MRVAWLHDAGNADGTKGGAELTMDEFKAAAPKGVTFDPDAETVVIGNCVTISPEIIPTLEGKRVFRYHHDLARSEPAELREWLDDNAVHIFTSPLHRERYGVSWDHGERDCHIIPPALKLDRFRMNREQRRSTKREGIVTVGSWQNPGKGGFLLTTWLMRNKLSADCYGHGAFAPQGHVTHYGGYDHADLPAILQSYEKFVFLPTAVEPFGRCAVEAWASGLEMIINDLVGARYYMEDAPDALESAAEDFWELVAA